jgi:glutathione S-transferase
MKMKLYFFPIAPNPTKVRLYIAEKVAAGAPLEVEEVLVDLGAGEQNSPEYRARNPFARLPALELADGTHLCESLAIIEYLEELHPDPPMIGRTPLERAQTRQLERVVDLDILGSIARIVHATNSPLGLPPVPELAEVARKRLIPALGFVDELLGDGRPFVAGERVTHVDCTLAAALQFGRFGSAEVGESFTDIDRWQRAYLDRPAIQGVINVGLDG